MTWIRVALLASIVGFFACALPTPSASEPAMELTRLPPGTELIAVPGAAEARVSCIWIAGEPGAPIVLNLLDATGPRCDPVLWHLRDLGFGVLAPTTSGLSPRATDAVYAEAVRRAGSQDALIVRGASTHTDVIATLLAQGHDPAVIVLGAPARANPDLAHALEHGSSAVLVFLAGDDAHVGADARNAIAAAVQSAGGRVVIDMQATHEDVLTRMRSLLTAEQTLFATRFPTHVRLAGDLFERRVIDSPILAHALAETLGAGVDRFEESLLLRWLRRLPADFADTYPEPALRALFDFGDPLGRLDPRELEWMGDVATQAEATRGATPLPEAMRAYLEAHELGGCSRYAIRHAWSQEPIAEGNFKHGDPRPWGTPARLNLDAAQAQRQLLRIALKAAGIPDRVAFDADATPTIEAFENGSWRRLRRPP